MSTPVVTAHEAVVGDGTRPAAGRARRWRRARWPLGLLALVVVAGILSALPEPRTSTLTLAPDNPGDLGARAAAQILGREGVDVRYVRHIADVESLAGPGSTVLVVGDYLLTGPAGRGARRDRSGPGARRRGLGAGAAHARRWRRAAATRASPRSARRSATTPTRSLPAPSRRAAACCAPAPARSSASPPRARRPTRAAPTPSPSPTGAGSSRWPTWHPLTNQRPRRAGQRGARPARARPARAARLVHPVARRRRRGRRAPAAPGELLPPVVPVLALQLAARRRGRRALARPPARPAGHRAAAGGGAGRRDHPGPRAAVPARRGPTGTPPRRCAPARPHAARRRLGLPPVRARTAVVDAVARAPARPGRTSRRCCTVPHRPTTARWCGSPVTSTHLESEVHRT